MPEPRSNKAKRWKEFADAVQAHIEEYAVGQYLDTENGLIEGWDAHTLMNQIEKYTWRHGSSMRGLKEQKADMLKIAYYASMIWTMLEQGTPTTPKESGDET